MIHLFEVYEQKLDAKGRVLFPSAFRKQLKAHLQDGFVIKRSIFEICLDLYPMQEWQKEIEEINKLNRYVKKNNDFIRLFMAGVKNVEIDDANRLLIPKNLIVFSNMKKDIVLASSVNRIELWDKEIYEETLKRDASDFSTLAEDVMGNVI